MEIQAGSHTYTLSPELLQRMRAIQARTDSVEHGLSICGQETGPGRFRLVPGQESVGGPTSIMIKDCVAGPGPTVGSFHTHPTANADPSYADALAPLLLAAENGRPALDCRAGRTGAIRCDVTRELPPREALRRMEEDLGQRFHENGDDLVRRYYHPRVDLPLAAPEKPRGQPEQPPAGCVPCGTFLGQHALYRRWRNPQTGREWLEAIS